MQEKKPYSGRMIEEQSKFLHSTRLLTPHIKDFEGKKRTFLNEEDKFDYEIKKIDQEMARFKWDLKKQGYDFNKLNTYYEKKSNSHCKQRYHDAMEQSSQSDGSDIDE